ncbi:helix-turn-helix transcriptional regulator [Christensenella intestinihominis]|uniref:helix-turn-helix transcriptional regulator n=1 Tax=Christensenella intestinihominis TaxID=1851429 RepID=UPI00083128FB|nr:helix-turn-helix transcriptional regulator [Christensenella intestinihominis]
MSYDSIFLKRPKIALIEWIGSGKRRRPENMDYTELVICMDGMSEVCAGSEYSHIDRRQLLVLQGGCGYRLMAEVPQNEKILRILLHDYQIRGHPENKIMEEDFLFLPLLKSSDFFLNSCAYLQQEWNSRDGPVKNEIITSALCILLYIIIDELKSMESDISDVTEVTRRYIEQNYNRELSLTQIASEVNFSIYYLAHLFKREMGVSPMQYLMNCRMEKAKELLLDTGRTISDIAAEVGYPNKNYFTMLFKRNVGITPGKFRKEGPKGRARERP